MSDLPSRDEAANRARQLHAEGLSFTAEYLALDGIASGRLMDREAMTQIGWFDPGSKRFCYTDEKEIDPERKASYTEPVFVAAAIGDTDE